MRDGREMIEKIYLTRFDKLKRYQMSREYSNTSI